MVDQNSSLGSRNVVQWLINSSLGSRNVVQWLIRILKSELCSVVDQNGSRNFVQWLIRTLVLDPGIFFSN